MIAWAPSASTAARCRVAGTCRAADHAAPPCASRDGCPPQEAASCPSPMTGPHASAPSRDRVPSWRSPSTQDADDAGPHDRAPAPFKPRACRARPSGANSHRRLPCLRRCGKYRNARGAAPSGIRDRPGSLPIKRRGAVLCGCAASRAAATRLIRRRATYGRGTRPAPRRRAVVARPGGVRFDQGARRLRLPRDNPFIRTDKP